MNEAEAVDALGRPRAPSTLPPGPDAVAQALLRSPPLRSLGPFQLARQLGATPSDARRGIAAVVSLARQGRGGVLRDDPALARQVAFLSTDRALTMWASNTALPVWSPSPNEAGAIGDPLSTAALTLYGYLTDTGCDCSADLQQLTKNFQSAYNADPADASPSSALTVDGYYGTDTQAALQWSLAQIGTLSPTPSAPAPCYTPGGPCYVPGGGGGGTPSPAPAPAPSGGGASSGTSPLVLLGLAAAGLGLVLAMRKKKRGRR